MFPFKSAIAIGIVLILVGAAILMGKSVVTTVSGLFKPSTTVVEAPKDNSAPPAKPKIPDRVGQPSSTDQVAPVAQRVVLYDEDPSDPKGKQYVGTVVWRTEPIKGTAGQPADIAVRADIDIPDRKFKMTMSFRRNTDTSLPASHTAELTFILPPDFAGGGVSNVPGILMKSNEQARGTPLAGLAVKVTDGFFLVGLSNVDADRARNIQLLKERSWFDVPLVYVNQRRAIIAIEKGAARRARLQRRLRGVGRIGAGLERRCVEADQTVSRKSEQAKPFALTVPTAKLLYRENRGGGHEAVSDFCGAGAVSRRVFSAGGDHCDVRLLGSADLGAK